MLIVKYLPVFLSYTLLKDEIFVQRFCGPEAAGHPVRHRRVLPHDEGGRRTTHLPEHEGISFLKCIFYMD